MRPTEKIHNALELAVSSTVNQIASGRIVCFNEATLQLHLSRAVMIASELFLSLPGETSFIELEKSWTGERKGRVDLWFGYRLQSGKTVACAVEMKFLKRESHKEPNNRYDVFKDILRLEECRSECDAAFMLVVTDHHHYHSDKKALSKNTSDFNFRHGAKYAAGTSLEYRTGTPQGPPIQLKNDYDFKWSNLQSDYRYLLTEVGKAHDQCAGGV